MIDVLLDALFDTIKLIPYLLITFIIIEFMEHKLSNKNKKILTKNKKLGPVIGSFLGGLPQCGFSAMASNLYSSRIITKGTLIAIFLSTSDEMLPIMISEEVNTLFLLKLVAFKILVGVIIGFIVDIIFKSKNEDINIDDICEHDNCNCHESGIVLSSIKHTIKTALFVLIANIFIGIIIYFVGEESLKNIILRNNILAYFISSLVGLIPNCASSVIITELYLSNLISLGTLMAGLLPGSGIGLLLLFKNNKTIKDSIIILGIIYLVGVIIGLMIDLIL